MRSPAAALCALALLGACAGTHRDGGVLQPGEPQAKVTTDELAATIRFLADDEMEGRAPGSRGDRLTREYLAAEMGTMGLEPGGPDGTWEQPFELIGVRATAPPHWAFAKGGKTVSIDARDFVAVGGHYDSTVAITDSEVVFVGYGIQAPEYHWDDFKGVDLRGKTLLMLNNDPDWDEKLFAGKRRLYYGRWTYKYESAARRGAAGAIVIHTDDSAGYPWQTVQTSWGGENSHLPNSDENAVAVQAWLTHAAAARVVALAGKDLNQLTAAARERRFVPVPLGVRTSIQVRNSVREYQTANVLGLLRGRDAAERANVVVLTAHHDHLGAVEKDGKRVIYNGAVDNAAGVAQMLAVARAFAAMPKRPRRSVLFAAVGAEEQGLLGSAYYARHPTFSSGRIMANLNIDGGNVWGRTRDITGVGFGKSTIDRYIALAAAEQNRRYIAEAFPEKGGFYRSDQFNFAKIGVPALFLQEGVDFVGRPEGWGKEQTEAWIAHHYHQPSDDFDPSWNLEGMVDDVRLTFRAALMIAETSDVPEWVPGDEFSATRAAARKEVDGAR